MPPELLDELIASIEEMVRNGESLPEEFYQELADILESFLPPPKAPTPSGAELVWILAGGNPKAFTEYLTTIPDPSLNDLAKNPLQLKQVINELSQRITMPHGEVEDGIPKASLQSSNVYGFAYNPRMQRLFVRFNHGGVYEYEGVPPQIFKIFSNGAIPAKTTGQNEFGKWWKGKNPSLGAAFYELIKNIYPYQKVA